MGLSLNYRGKRASIQFVTEWLWGNKQEEKFKNWLVENEPSDAFKEIKSREWKLYLTPAEKIWMHKYKGAYQNPKLSSTLNASGF
ncbi:hypothetical protein LB465_12445 [Salegentibacter sp. LM13S]|uniref:hypothetical protein n=1 Tax=Salegentibacter lacus TaxID=2873599 RepID=UPI001CC97787|nr:hypothetical protein [Salegentibacter lacus]MBZ9631592.1 hypothetical protein [Salegentibacter lacus]